VQVCTGGARHLSGLCHRGACRKCEAGHVASSDNVGPGTSRSALRRIFRPLRSAEIDLVKHGSVRRFFALLGSIWDLGAYVYVLLAGLTAVSRKLSGDVPVFLQSIHAVFPLVIAPAVVVLAVSILRRRAILIIVAALLCVTGYFAIAPARSVPPRPSWFQGAPTFSVLSSNVFYLNQSTVAAAQTLVSKNADLVIVSELTDVMLRTLDDQGFAATYPHRATVMSTYSNGSGIFSKYPFKETRRWGTDKLPDVDVQLPTGEVVRVLAVHPLPPLDETPSISWNRDLRRLKERAKSSVAQPFLAVGDFNGSRWQPRFGSLLTELDDAHESLGKGLSASWPVNKTVPRFTRIDHALYNQRLFPTAVTDFTVPGSDHRAFVVTLAVRRNAPPENSGADPAAQTSS
jgi:endonuclease/exonuclease/phosphatase (EEP) superfamily protein YafD